MQQVKRKPEQRGQSLDGYDEQKYLELRMAIASGDTSKTIEFVNYRNELICKKTGLTLDGVMKLDIKEKKQLEREIDKGFVIFGGFDEESKN